MRTDSLPHPPLNTLIRYSWFFHTLYDEQGPSAKIGRGTHYSVLRAVLTAQRTTHDFAVIWDEDHDERVIWCAEQLLVRGLLQPVRFIGERKGGLNLIVAYPLPPRHVHAVEGILRDLPSDDWCGPSIETLGGASGMIINARADEVQAYLGEIAQKWHLGTKPIELRLDPFAYDETGLDDAFTEEG